MYSLLQNILKKKNTSGKILPIFLYSRILLIKRIAFENAYESSIIFQPFSYANVPAKSLPYAPTFFHQYISLFCYYLSLQKGMVLHLNKLKSPSPKDGLYQVWLKLIQWFWRRRKCEKFTTTMTPMTMTTTMDKAHLSLWLR